MSANGRGGRGDGREEAKGKRHGAYRGGETHASGGDLLTPITVAHGRHHTDAVRFHELGQVRHLFVHGRVRLVILLMVEIIAGSRRHLPREIDMRFVLGLR